MADAPPLAAALETLLARRYSCRGFRPGPVPREIIERILLTAQRTASWCNAQPWQVIVTSGPATDRLREALYRHAAANVHAPGGVREYEFDAPREYRGVYQQRRRECGLQLYASLGIGRHDRDAATRQALENFRFFGAPHLAIVTSEESLATYGAIDCGAYVANFMLAASALGVAAIAQAAIASCAQFLHQFLAIPLDRKLICGISFGYADEDNPANGFRTTRASLDETVIWLDQ
jgi:nitroreductase